MHVTVIVPTWKRVIKLQACLESLEVQTTPPDLVVLVARKEDSETENYLRLWSSKTRLKHTVLLSNRPGVIYAENNAISYVLKEKETQIVTFMDDDAIALPDWIMKIKTFFLLHPEAAALGGPDIIFSEPWSYYNFPVETVGRITFFGKVIGNHHRKSSGLRKVDVLKGVNMSVLKTYLHSLDTDLQGDDPAKGNGVFWELDLCLSIQSRGGKIFFDPDLIIQHDSNHSHFIEKSVISSTAHNLALVMMKHFPLRKKIIFVSYSLLIGNSHVRGLLKTVSVCFKERSLRSLSLSKISITGFLIGAGLRFFHRPK